MITIDNPSQEIFNKYLNEETPFIITNVLNKWNAYKKWNESFFVKKYGEKKLMCFDIKENNNFVISLKDYFDYLSHDDDNLWYLKNINIEELDINLYNDFDISLVNHNDFIRTLRKIESLFTYAISKNTCLRWLFFGKKNTSSPLHLDVFGTTAWLGLISGRKKFVIYNKYQTTQIDLFLLKNHKEIEDINFENLNESEKKFFDTLSPYEFVLNPGEIIVTPSKLYHYVKNLENSIAITENFSHSIIDEDVLYNFQNENSYLYYYMYIGYLIHYYDKHLLAFFVCYIIYLVLYNFL